ADQGAGLDGGALQLHDHRCRQAHFRNLSQPAKEYRAPAVGPSSKPARHSEEGYQLMQIYLLRHGIAENARPGQADAERALTGEGRDKLRRVLKRARLADVSPAVVLSSPYRRAIETADVAVEIFGYQGKVVLTRALVPEASPHDAWEEIRSRK